jgi:hypothetical protein
MGKTWGDQVAIRKVNDWGVGIAGTRVQGSAVCKGKCKVKDGSFKSQPLKTDKDALGQWHLDSTLAAAPTGKRGAGFTRATWQFTNAQWSGPSTPGELDTVDVRCDTQLPGVKKLGCTMPQYYPAMVYAKKGQYPELAKHIEYAQNTKKLPGKYGSKKFLTRLTDTKKKDKNREKACPKRLPRPPGKTCDEYPFASTWQGAYTGGGKFSRRMIDADQNEDGGRALKDWYLYNRMLDKDKFQVWIKP